MKLLLISPDALPFSCCMHGGVFLQISPMLPGRILCLLTFRFLGQLQGCLEKLVAMQSMLEVAEVASEEKAKGLHVKGMDAFNKCTQWCTQQHRALGHRRSMINR